MCQNGSVAFCLGKNAGFPDRNRLFWWIVCNLCSNKWGCAFFGVQFRLELHTFLLWGGEK